MIDSIVEFAVPAIMLSATSYSSPDSLNLDFDGCGFSDWLRHAISVLIGISERHRNFFFSCTNWLHHD